MTNQGVLIELSLELVDDDKETMLGILNVRQGDQRLALALVPSNEPYANMYTRALGCMPFLLLKDYSPLPTSQRTYIQNWGLHDWKEPWGTSSSTRWAVELDGSIWQDEGWICYGWYPLIGMTRGTRLNPKEDSEPPSQFLASFTDQQSTILCYFRVAATQLSTEIQAAIAVAQDQVLTPLDGLYSLEP